jgi:uncharacterized delta-60 repeat protein
MARGPGGKIVLAGVAQLGRGADVAVARFNADGSLDNSFGPGGADGDGRVRISLGSGEPGTSAARDVAVLPDGRVLVAANADIDARPDFALVRLGPSGAVERTRTFAFLGSATGSGFSEARATGLALVPGGGGDFFVAGTATPANRNPNFAAARYNADFSLDDSFGGDGRVTVDFGGRSDVATDLAPVDGGRLLLVGHSTKAAVAGGADDTAFALARLNADGSLDRSFDEGSGGLDGDGRRLTQFGRGEARANSVAVAPGGKYVVAGAAVFREEGSSISEADFAVARYQGDAAPPPPTPTPPDGDDQIAEAPRMSVGQTVSRSIGFRQDVDMVKFTVRAGQRIAFDVDGGADSPLDSFLRVFDAAGRQLASNDNRAAPGESSTTTTDSYLEFTFPSAGTFYAAVSAKRNSRYNPVTGEGDVDGGRGGAFTLALRNVAAMAAPAHAAGPALRLGAARDRQDDDDGLE